MTIEIVRSVLGWCLVCNIAIIIFWFAMFVFAHDWVYNFHNKYFKLSVETFDAIHYAEMGLFKLGIFLLNFMPYVALWFLSL